MRRKLLTVIQVAEELNVTTRYVRHLVFERRIDYVKIGNLVRIPSTAIDEIVERGFHKATRNVERPRPTAEASMSRGIKVEPCIYRVGPKRFRIMYRDQRGQQRERTIRGSLVEARHFRAQRILERHNLRLPDSKGERAALLELVPEYLAEKAGLRRRTQEKIESSLRCHVMPAFGEFSIGAIRRGDIQK